MKSRYPNYCGSGRPFITKPARLTRACRPWVPVGGVYRESFGRPKRIRATVNEYILPNNFKVQLKRVRGSQLPRRCCASSYALFG